MRSVAILPHHLPPLTPSPQVHRPSHFMNFASIEEGAEQVGADREDMFQ